MQIELTLSQPIEHGAALANELVNLLQNRIAELHDALITDLSHISHFVNANDDDMRIDKIEFEADNEYLMFYSFGWQINNACADQLDEGRAHEKVRFTLQSPGLVNFKILCFD